MKKLLFTRMMTTIIATRNRTIRIVMMTKTVKTAATVKAVQKIKAIKTIKTVRTVQPIPARPIPTCSPRITAAKIPTLPTLKNTKRCSWGNRGITVSLFPSTAITPSSKTETGK